jgi:hypothetical protein
MEKWPHEEMWSTLVAMCHFMTTRQGQKRGEGLWKNEWSQSNSLLGRTSAGPMLWKEQTLALKSQSGSFIHPSSF